MHQRSEVIRRLALLRQSKWRREQMKEILVKGRSQIENIIKYNKESRFKEVIVSNKLGDYDFLSDIPTHRIKLVDPKLLYYIAYHSKPVVSKTKTTAEDGHMDEEILANPMIGHSLMVGTLPIPSQKLPSNMKLVLCLNDVIFPDNVGGLIQAAHGVGGVDAIIGTERTCDFYGWKVLEASKGYGFSIPKKRITEVSEINLLAKEHNLLPIVGHSKDGVDFSTLDVSKYSGLMVVVGNEKHGPSEEILDIATPVRIPINIHSLNVSVAGGILLQLAKSSIS